jgi:hypothetical protein
MACASPSSAKISLRLCLANGEAQPRKQGKLDGKAQPFRTSGGIAAGKLTNMTVFHDVFCGVVWLSVGRFLWKRKI